MIERVIRVAAIAVLVFVSTMGDARAASPDVAHRFSALVTDFRQSQEREDIVRVGNELLDFSASLTDTQLDALPAADIEVLVSMVGHAQPPRELLATDMLGKLGRRAADALPMLQRLGWESPDIVCEPGEVVCVRSGPPYFVGYMVAFEDIRTNIVAHGQKLPDGLERGNDIRIRQGIERVLAERDPAVAQEMMEALAWRATMLPESAMDRLDDSTIDSLAALLEAEPGIRFEAAGILGHAGERAARAIPALERAKRSSIGVPTKWHHNNEPEPISGDEYIGAVVQDISAK